MAVKLSLSVILGFIFWRMRNVQFTSMDDVIHLLKTQEITRVSRSKLKRITSVDLVILDDLMFMAIKSQEPFERELAGSIRGLLKYKKETLII